MKVEDVSKALTRFSLFKIMRSWPQFRISRHQFMITCIYWRYHDIYTSSRWKWEHALSNAKWSHPLISCPGMDPASRESSMALSWPRMFWVVGPQVRWWDSCEEGEWKLLWLEPINAGAQPDKFKGNPCGCGEQGWRNGGGYDRRFFSWIEEFFKGLSVHSLATSTDSNHGEILSVILERLLRR